MTRINSKSFWMVAFLVPFMHYMSAYLTEILTFLLSEMNLVSSKNDKKADVATALGTKQRQDGDGVGEKSGSQDTQTVKKFGFYVSEIIHWRIFI